MNRKTAKAKISKALFEHNVRFLVGMQIQRAKCNCGWTVQGANGLVKNRSNLHQAEAVTNELFGIEAELIEE